MSDMTEENVPSPEQLQRLKELVQEGEESGPATPMTAEDWVSIRREGRRRLKELVLEGLNSGDPVEVTPEGWERKRAELARHLPLLE